MLTHGTTDQAGAPSSPSSRADRAPSDSESPAAAATTPDVVDVTGAQEPWAATPARRTVDPAPLRASKSAPPKAVPTHSQGEAAKGKKKLARRPAASSSTRDATAAGDSPHGSEHDLEEKPAAPPAKKARKAPTKAKPVKAVSRGKRAPAVTRPDSGFNLSDFMESFEGRSAVVERAPTEDLPAGAAAASSTSMDVGDQVQALEAEVARLRAVVASQAVLQSPSQVAGARRASVSSPTAPNSKGELPPPEVCYLTTSSFPEGAKKAKGDYSPPQAHLLAASRMFRSFGTEAGKPLSAMSFVLAMRELENAKFRMTPAVLMAIFSGRLGSRGLTVLHFKESSELATLEDGSSNVNFSSDFSPSASLPSAVVDCGTYEDILDALHGLAAFGQDLWYDHMRKLTSRLRNFVSKNKSADPDNTPARVRLTLLYVNKFMGTALGFMQLDDPQWWNGFCEALRAVDYQSPTWTMALVGAMSMLKRADGEAGVVMTRRDSSRKETVRRPAIPDAIRRLIPINQRGQEPCLLNVAGLPCSGGSRDRCGNSRRVHNWPESLPARLKEWVERTYGSRGPHGEDRR